jgi:hypothetical protein
MMRSSSFLSSYPGVRSTRTPLKKTSQGVADFLRSNDKLASLLPSVTRIAAMQRDCQQILPAIFESCSVLRFESEELVLSTPNAAFAAKLKQQLPKLQVALVQRGWQVNAIRLKVQVSKFVEKTIPPKQLILPQQAFSALASLNESLDNSPQNEALKAALNTLLNRHRKTA